MNNELENPLDKLQKLLSNHQYSLTAAVTNGFVTGMLCAGVGAAEEDFVINLQQVLNEGEILELTVIDNLKEISEVAAEQLNSGILQLQLAIEDDHASLPQRLKNLSEWSEGWLLGFGHGADSGKLSKDSIEVLGDIRNMSQVDFELEETIAEEEVEELERAYIEILEHLKVSVEMLFLEKKQTIKQTMPTQKSDNIH